MLMVDREAKSKLNKLTLNHFIDGLVLCLFFMLVPLAVCHYLLVSVFCGRGSMFGGCDEG